MAQPIIAVVGRPNVGKSTLFNRLLHRRLAIEDDTPGVTRDRLAAEMEWNGVPFTIVDTGGLMTRADEEMDALVSAAAEAAIDEADRIVFVVDGTLGVSDLDQAIASKVLRSGKDVVLAVTKIDSLHREAEIYEYYSLGLGEPVGVSGVSGHGTGDLLDRMVEGFPKAQPHQPDPGTVHLAVLGRPNVGKSSMVNRLIGKDAQIVTEIPGTTRDAVDHYLRYMGRDLVLVDTAGLRRKWTIATAGGKELDYYTSLRTIRALDRSDVAAVLIDAPEGLTQYERRLIDEVRQKGKGLIAVFNKWDLVEKDAETMDRVVREFRDTLPDLDFVPVLFSSALTGFRSRKLLDMALKVHDERQRRISTSNLNKFVEATVAQTPPPAVKGRWLRIKYASQVATEPPVFAFFLNEPELMPGHYQRFLENRLRDEYGFEGVPIKVVFRKK